MRSGYMIKNKTTSIQKSKIDAFILVNASIIIPAFYFLIKNFRMNFDPDYATKSLYDKYCKERSWPKNFPNECTQTCQDYKDYTCKQMLYNTYLDNNNKHIPETIYGALSIPLSIVFLIIIYNKNYYFFKKQPKETDDKKNSLIISNEHFSSTNNQDHQILTHTTNTCTL